MKAAIILARIDSSRFPRKAVTKVGGKRLIEWSIDALISMPEIKPILATTDRAIDDPLAIIAAQKGIAVFRGDLDNVAERVAGCIQAFEIDSFARINGDSPFLPQKDLLEAFSIIEDPSIDFVTNLLPRAFPYGVSIEVMKSSFYLAHLPQLTSAHYREHLTSYFYDHIDQFKVHKIKYAQGNDHEVRLVVDTPEDKDRIENILAQIPQNQTPEFSELVNLYKNTFNT